ncbi:hypothetical protein GGI12_003911 [Dipsacomyces acuminosporus]|nr:hypothetical protein GGI12_003911 [Dipsacomyces acuminosporus]
MFVPGSSNLGAADTSSVTRTPMAGSSEANHAAAAAAAQEPPQQQQPVRVMLSCDNCRRKKIRCNGGAPPKSTASSSNSPAPGAADQGGASTGHRSKRRASTQCSDDNEPTPSLGAGEPTPGLSSTSHLMLESVRETNVLELPQAAALGAAAQGHLQQPSVMEMLRLQTQISGLVDQLRNITIRASGLTPAGTPLMSPTMHAAPEHHDHSRDGAMLGTAAAESPSVASFSEGYHRQQQQQQQQCDDRTQQRFITAAGGGSLASTQAGGSAAATPGIAAATAVGIGSTSGIPGDCKPRCNDLHISKAEHSRGISVSRDLINHLISVYFQYCHPSETGMHPIELYKDRLQRAQVSEPFLLSVLAVASRLSDDPRVKREPAYLSGYDFFERVTRGLMMDVLERDCVENMLTLNNLAVYAVGLPVANRGWYFSGLSMRMATQMSLQKVDAPGRMPGASMMSGPGIESARRAFWTTLLLEALASFASGEPPPITSQDIHVAEPYDEPGILEDEPAESPGIGMGSRRNSTLPPSSGASSTGLDAGAGSTRGTAGAKGNAPNVCAYIAQLAVLLIRVARLNGNRHPESAQFSPEYAALHTEMVAWYHGLPDNMHIKPTTAKDEIQRDPQLFAAKMFIHCHYHAAIIALHQPRVDLVRVESAGGLSRYPGNGVGGDGVAGAKDQGQRFAGSASSGSGMQCSHGPSESEQQWTQLAQQQCLTAACSMTELLTLARNLDVRYHIVTFGFAVFMAGVVHVGAVACTPRDSNERQYSINCVKEHVKCLDRLGKYFAFHFIMAKHIRAQLQAIETMDMRRQKETVAAVAAAAAAAAAASTSSSALNAGLLSMASQPQPPSAMSFSYPAALQANQTQHQGSSGGGVLSSPAAFQGMSFGSMGLDVGLLGSASGRSSIFNGATNGSPSSSWMSQAAGSATTALPTGTSGASMAPPATSRSSSSVDMFLGLFNSQTPQTPGTAPFAADAQASAASNALFGLQGFSGMVGLGTGIGSLLELFSSNSDGMSSLYPENILSSSSLAPSNNQETTPLQARQGSPVDSTSNQQQPQSQPQQARFGSSPVQVDPAAPLRLTSPGAFHQFGSLPPFSPI